MKKNQIKICIFISITLFLLFSTIALASSAEVNFDDALKELVGDIKIVGYDKEISKSNEGKNYIDGKYFVEFPEKYLDSNGNLTIGGKKVECYIAIDQGNGITGDAYDITKSIAYDNYLEGYASEFVFKGTNNVDTYNKGFREGMMICYLKDSETGKIIAEYKIPGGNKAPQINSDANKHIPIGSETNKWGAGFKAFILEDYTDVGKILIESLVKLILPCGDGFLHMMSRVFGEIVTIDKIVFGDVEKLSIDFFSSSDVDAKKVNSKVMPLKDILSNVINSWYGFFLKVAILFYLILLVYMGIRIILASTGEKKAEYKTRLVSWMMGIVMLIFFPYVMKYIILANKGFCMWIGEIGRDTTKSNTTIGDGFNIADVEITNYANVYGTSDFVTQALGYGNISKSSEDSLLGKDIFGNNIMLKIRFFALEAYSLPLAVSYIILLGETFVLVIMYYKRVFMLAFLITIFPLAAMFYTLNKTGDMKLNSFSIWFKEFVVNVFVQAFHAVTYVTTITIGLTAYQQSGNWIFFLICVLFLFQGEKIIRAIFNAQSSMGTIGDMAAAGAITFGALKNASKLLGSKGKSKGGDGDDSDDSAKDEKAKANRDNANKALNANTPTQGTEKNKAAAESLASGQSKDGAAGNKASRNGKDVGTIPQEDTEVKLGREPVTSHQEVYNSVNKRIEKKMSEKKHPALKVGANVVGKFAGFTVKHATAAASMMVAGSFAAAQHTDTKSTGAALATATTAYGAGKKFGENAINTVSGTYTRAKEHAYAAAIAREYENGEHDDEFVINEADEQLRKKKMEAYRKIAAKVASERAKHGKDAAEKVFIREELDTKK